jgi:response regulator RpfG family c-di-GMP phosphodiesterase
MGMIFEGEMKVHEGRILVVDDEETVRKSIQKRLEKEGYNVISSDNAIDALKIFENMPFDVVISDIRMKEMDGIELLRGIQRLQRDVPVIMITGDPSIETAQNSVKEGAYDYITKPINREALIQTVERAIRQKRLSDKVKEYQRELERKVKEQTRIIHSLFEFANRLNSLSTLKDVTKSVIQAVTKFALIDKCMVAIYDQRRKELIVHESTEMEIPQGLAIHIGERDPLCMKALESKGAFLIERISFEDPIFGWEAILERGFDLPWILVGLKTPSELLGMILASKKEQVIDYEEQLKILSYIADSASVSINNKIMDQKLKESYFNILRALTLAVEAKDPYTRGHSERVMRYAIGVAKKMGLPEDEIIAIGNAAILHDIGKIEISKFIINKPDRLSDEEYLEMKDHPAIGEIMIENIQFLEASRLMIRHHHERYDGMGYPDGLKGDEIPIGARIISVVDMYDALTTDRPYMKDPSKERAILNLREQKGKSLDPMIVDVFIEYLKEIEMEGF